MSRLVHEEDNLPIVLATRDEPVDSGHPHLYLYIPGLLVCVIQHGIAILIQFGVEANTPV
jgi:hypothetical protein